MAFETFSLADSLNAASSYGKTKMAIEDYQNKKERNKQLNEARRDASTGYPKAIKRLMAVAPDEAGKIIDSLSKMDKSAREAVDRDSAETTKSMLWVMQGKDKAEQSQRWDQVIDFMGSQGKKGAEQYKGKFSEGLAQQFMMKAMSVKDINDQFAFGNVKAGMQDGKPVYFMTNKEGGSQVLEGIKPTPKEISGASGKGFEMKASDSNSIRAAAAGLFGGIWDPTTGRVSGVSKEMTSKVAAVSEEASRIYKESGGNKTHDQAAAEAARKLGIDIQQLNKPKDDPSRFTIKSK